MAKPNSIRTTVESYGFGSPTQIPPLWSRIPRIQFQLRHCLVIYSMNGQPSEAWGVPPPNDRSGSQRRRALPQSFPPCRPISSTYACRESFWKITSSAPCIRTCRYETVSWVLRSLERPLRAVRRSSCCSRAMAKLWLTSISRERFTHALADSVRLSSCTALRIHGSEHANESSWATRG